MLHAIRPAQAHANTAAAADTNVIAMILMVVVVMYVIVVFCRISYTIIF